MTIDREIRADDAASAKSSIKGERVSGDVAKKQGEEWAQIAGSKIDNTVCHPNYCPPYRFMLTCF